MSNNLAKISFQHRIFLYDMRSFFNKYLAFESQYVATFSKYRAKVIV